MADETMSIVKLVSQRLASFMDEEQKYKYALENKTDKLQLDLEWCRYMLEELERTKDSNFDSIHGWISQIREFANEAREILDKYGLLISRAEENCCTALGRVCCCDSRRKALGEISSRIDALSRRILRLATRMRFRGVRASPPNWIYTGSGDSDTASQAAGDEIARFEEDTVSKLAQQVVNRDEKEKEEVAVIYGQPGSGKTTLAKMVCRREDVREHFDCFVWVPPYSRTKKVLEWIWLELHGGDYYDQRKKIRGMEIDKIQMMIKSQLRLKKLFLVLDDVQNERPSIGLLRAVSALISSSRTSKLMLITSSEVVQRMAITNAGYHQPKLSDEQSQQLLRKVVSQRNRGIGAFVDSWGNKMSTQRCKNNPLAIIVLGGILAHKNTEDEWKKLYDSTEKKIKEDSVLEDVMELSFLELPAYLRPYMLHVGNLPRDIPIPANKLYRIWIAEGLVVRSGPGPEDIASGYLNELVQRGLVEVVSRGKTGKVKAFRVHDIMRRICRQKATGASCHIISSSEIVRAVKTKKSDSKAAKSDAKKAAKSDAKKKKAGKSDAKKEAGESDATSYYYKSAGSIDSFPLATTLSTRILHGLAVRVDHDRDDNDMKNISFPDGIVRNCGHLQSLLFLPNNSDGRIPRGWLRSLVGSSFELRVLHVENAKIYALPEQIGRLVQLKYLSLRGTTVTYELPSSIGELSLLETLDLRVFPSGEKTGILGLGGANSFVVLPDVFYKLRRLRHLFLPESYVVCSMFGRRLHFHELTKLETLKNLNLRLCKVKGLECLEALRKFTWKVDDEMDMFEVSDKKILKSLLRSPSVQSGRLTEKLVIKMDGELVIKMDGEMLCSENDGQELAEFAGYKNSVEGLIVLGSLTTLDIRRVLEHLTTLVLRLTKLSGDPMTVLGDLQHLKNLRLSYRSFVGDSMSCQAEKFLMLEHLKLDMLSNLVNWTVQSGSMPKLKLVEIEFCDKLSRIPDELAEGVKVHCLLPCISWNRSKRGLCPYCEEPRGSTATDQGGTAAEANNSDATADGQTTTAAAAGNDDDRAAASPAGTEDDEGEERG